MVKSKSDLYGVSSSDVFFIDDFFYIVPKELKLSKNISRLLYSGRTDELKNVINSLLF